MVCWSYARIGVVECAHLVFQRNLLHSVEERTLHARRLRRQSDSSASSKSVENRTAVRLSQGWRWRFLPINLLFLLRLTEYTQYVRLTVDSRRAVDLASEEENRFLRVTLALWSEERSHVEQIPERRSIFFPI